MRRGIEKILLPAGVVAVVAAIMWSGTVSASIPEQVPRKPLLCTCTGKIVPDQALFWALVNRGVPPKVVESFRIPLSKVLDMRKIYPGDSYELVYTPSGEVVRFELVRSPWEKYVVYRQGDSLVAEKDTIPLTHLIVSAEGVVRNTLWESMRSAGIEPAVIMNFTDILSYDFDFVTDTRNGHRFRVIYEKTLFGDSLVGVGRVLLASYQTPDSTYTAIWYVDPEGREGYFDPAGKSMKKALLKAPLNYKRISSHFSYHRFHPILKIYRPHLGVDYAAPTGTPVVASGDGVVVYAGWKGGFGKFIHIKHKNGIETMYGHLSRFAKGIRRGVRVKRGQVIGYVGATGLATGPHLDYRVKVKGKFVNPEKYAFPAEPPVKRKYLSEYKKYARSVLEGARILANSAGNGEEKPGYSRAETEEGKI
ncbi:M23 family metallopeptidase [bacterium]|nr:M23 family metallopeptidase [bacterium]